MAYTVNPAPPSPPVALFSASTSVAYVGDAINFDGTASYQSAPDQSCDPTVTHQLGAYAWDFGDGTGQAQGAALASHAFSSPGLYNVILRVTDVGGAAGLAAATHAVSVIPRPEAPQSLSVPPPQTPPPPKKATVQLPTGLLSVDAGGYVTVRVSCLRAPHVCAGQLQLTTAKPVTRHRSHALRGARASPAPKTIVLATAPFSVAAGKSAIVRLRLSSAGRAIVRGAGAKGLASTLTALPQGAHPVLSKAARPIRLLSAAKPPRAWHRSPPKRR
jgi:PKD repeat protein